VREKDALTRFISFFALSTIMADDTHQLLELARAKDKDFACKKQKALAHLGLHQLVFSKKARTRHRRAYLLSQGLFSTKKRSSRADVPMPEDSAWGIFIRSPHHSSEAWHDWVGPPEHAFRILADSCEELWMTEPLLENNGSPRPCDLKKRVLDCTGTIALPMYYINHRGDESTFGKIFGLVDTDVQKCVEFGLQIALPVLRRNPVAKIYWPLHDIACLDRMAGCIERYVPGFEDEIGRYPVGFLDAVRMIIVNKGDKKAKKQDQTKEKMLALRKCQLVFDPMNRCVACALNSPPWGDGKCCIRGKLCKKIRQLPQGPPKGHCMLTDTACQGSLRNCPIVKMLKEGQFIPADLTEDEVRELEKKIIRGRQPSEWGNNQFVQFVVRPRCKLSNDDVHNGCLLELGILLHNFRLHYSDRNQLKRFFKNLEAFEEDPNLDPENILAFDEESDDDSDDDDSSILSNN